MQKCQGIAQMSETQRNKEIASSAFHRLLKCNLVVVFVAGAVIVGVCFLTLKMKEQIMQERKWKICEKWKIL
jgi:hypothetical protein